MSTTTTSLTPAGLLLLGVAGLVAFLAVAAVAGAAALVAAASFAALFDGTRI